MAYDVYSMELRISSITGSIALVPHEMGTLQLEQRQHDMAYWKNKIEGKWWFDTDGKSWLFAVSVAYSSDDVRTIRSQYDYAGLLVFLVDPTCVQFRLKGLDDGPGYLEFLAHYADGVLGLDELQARVHSISNVVMVPADFGNEGFMKLVNTDGREYNKQVPKEKRKREGASYSHTIAEYNNFLVMNDEFKLNMHQSNTPKVSEWLIRSIHGAFHKSDDSLPDWDELQTVIEYSISAPSWSVPTVLKDLLRCNILKLDLSQPDRYEVDRRGKEYYLKLLASDLHVALFPTMADPPTPAGGGGGWDVALLFPPDTPPI